MRSWRRVFTSEEARIEALAGQSLPETAVPAADRETPAQQGSTTPVAPEAAETGAPNDFPMPVPPPYEADDEDEATPDEADS